MREIFWLTYLGLTALLGPVFYLIQQGIQPGIPVWIFWIIGCSLLSIVTQLFYDKIKNNVRRV